MPPMLIMSIIGFLLNAFLGWQSPIGAGVTKLDNMSRITVTQQL